MILSEQMLKDIKVAPSFSVDTLVRKTVGLSGSDLKETCRNAAMVRRSALRLWMIADSLVIDRCR